MDAHWTVTMLLALLAALNAVALIGLTRQVGLLHIRIRPLPALDTEDGPEPGDQLSFATAPWSLPEVSPSVDRLLLAFFSPTCSICRPLLPGLQSIARAQTAAEATVLVADVEPSRAAAYLSENRIRLPCVAEPGAMKANNIPGAPYVAVTNSTGAVLSAGGVNTLEQVEWLIARARDANSTGTKGGNTEQDEMSSDTAVTH